MNKLFGTDGIRGIAGEDLTPNLAFKVGRSLLKVLYDEKVAKPKETKILIGSDTRISKDLIFHSLASGITSIGGDVINAGIIPTPAMPILLSKYKANAGIIISASHNPFSYNGIKIFSKDGYKLKDEEEDSIENHIISSDSFSVDTKGYFGSVKDESNNAKEIYLDFLRKSFKEKIKKVKGKRKIKIVIDCANGASFLYAPLIFKEFGFDVIPINNEPDGFNINEKAGSTYPKVVAKKVIEKKADLGFSYDGDADRLICVDEKGEIVDGDKLLYLFSKYLKSEGKLKNNLVVITIMSNLGLHLKLNEEGIKFITTSVGDRYVLEELRKKKGVLGGEQSGHIIFLGENKTGDGIYASLMLLLIFLKANKKLSQLSDELKILPQVLENAIVSKTKKYYFDENEEIIAQIKKYKKILKNEGRIVVRASGTENKVRVMIEGKNLKEIKKYAKDLAELIEKKCK